MTDVEPRRPGGRSLTAIVAATVLLTVGAALVGTLDRAVPTRTVSGWQVTDVPGELLAVLIATAVVCVAVGALLTRPGQVGSAAAAVWWSTAAAAAFALVWNDLYLASLRGDGGIIPVLNWLPSFLPALLVGLVARRRGREAHLRATVGTAVVTLPLAALGWTLVSGEGTGAAVAGALWSVGVLGVAPLAAAVFLTRVQRPAGMAVSRT